MQSLGANGVCHGTMCELRMNSWCAQDEIQNHLSDFSKKKIRFRIQESGYIFSDEKQRKLVITLFMESFQSLQSCYLEMKLKM